MPTVTLDKQELYQILEKEYETAEFRELCFDFGIELEEDTSELPPSEETPERPQLKIDIPANRFDLLCIEGISRAINVFLGRTTLPDYTPVPVLKRQRLIVKSNVHSVRPFVVGAILRNVNFTPSNYQSFMDLQDKLHNNICRKRTLAAIGTHDLDTIKGPFTYDARAPKDITFVPLNQTKSMNAEELMTFYEADRHLNKFLHIIRDSPRYPVILDSNNVVLSLPPIINGEHSKITLNTKNVFIECTATDMTKVKIVLNTMVAMFSQYCKDPFTYEEVEVVYEGGEKCITPNMENRSMTTEAEYIRSRTGLNDLTVEEMTTLLKKMCLPSKPLDNSKFSVSIPPTRSDILHSCDIMEDVAIAYGYNNIPTCLPTTTTVGAAFPLNKLSDSIRKELALSGFTEILPLILCSHEENFSFLNKKDNGKEAVLLANPKTVEYQVVRTSLFPGVLKTVQWNKKLSLPLKVFEVSDVVLKEPSIERGARNERRMCALVCGKTSNFELIHGLLNRVMKMLNIKFVESNQMNGSDDIYTIRESESPTFFPKRCADIIYRNQVIGSFGILHPEVLEKFEINYPCSAIEMNIEPFL